MGLLDRWSKRKQQEQLEHSDEKAVVVEKSAKGGSTSGGKVESKTEETKAVKTVAKKASTTKEEPVAVVAPADAEKKNVLASKVLIKPLVTEKSAVAESLNKYSFLINRSANKYQVQQAIFEMYGVKPLSVNVMNVQGKWVRFGRTTGRHSDFRKAVVTLPKGKTIAIHKGV